MLNERAYGLLLNDCGPDAMAVRSILERDIAYNTFVMKANETKARRCVTGVRTPREHRP